MRELALDNIEEGIVKPEGHWQAVLAEFVGNVHFFSLLQLVDKHQFRDSDFDKADSNKEEALDGTHIHDDQ